MIAFTIPPFLGFVEEQNRSLVITSQNDRSHLSSGQRNIALPVINRKHTHYINILTQELLWAYSCVPFDVSNRIEFNLSQPQ